MRLTVQISRAIFRKFPTQPKLMISIGRLSGNAVGYKPSTRVANRRLQIKWNETAKRLPLNLLNQMKQ